MTQPYPPLPDLNPLWRILNQWDEATGFVESADLAGKANDALEATLHAYVDAGRALQAAEIARLTAESDERLKDAVAREMEIARLRGYFDAEQPAIAPAPQAQQERPAHTEIDISALADLYRHADSVTLFKECARRILNVPAPEDDLADRLSAHTPQAQPERKPMSEAEIYHMVQAQIGKLRPSFTNLVREIEAFHGIKETP